MQTKGRGVWGWGVALLLAGALPGAEPVSTTAGSLRIAEFLADNGGSLRVEGLGTPDWIEIWNPGPHELELAGYALSDNIRKPAKWVFPAGKLGAGERRLVHATGWSGPPETGRLQASFKLSAAGGTLLLSAPDGRVLQQVDYPVQFEDVSFGFADGGSGSPWFLPEPTPGRANGLRDPGPRLTEATNATVGVEALDRGLRVQVRAVAGAGELGGVQVRYRIQFEKEKRLDLVDDGTGGDAAAADGIWTGTVPTVGLKPGTLVRWQFEARDGGGGAARWPLSGKGRVPRMLGTVVGADVVRSALPVFHLFVPPGEVGMMESDQGADAGVYLDGEYYDGVRIKVRGNTTAGFPKKSHRLEFDGSHPLRHPGPGGRIRNTSLMAEWGDPTYLRQHLSFWLMERAGVPAPFHEPVRVQLNGEFYQLAMHSQVLGEELLERTGLDPDGALYKAVGTLTPAMESTGGFEKKTRRHEDERDYLEFARALTARRGAAVLERELLDRCDVPAVINYLAVARLTQEDDDIWANLSLYRDTEGSGRWRPVAFDMNVSWGLSFGVGGVVADQDALRSHPFWGAAGIGSNQGHNALYDAVIRTPVTRQMLLRRMRTLLDRDWQPPGTPVSDRVLEQHVRELRARMAPEAALDREKWGESWNAGRQEGPGNSLQNGIRDLERRFIEPRRRHFYVTHSVTNAVRKVGVGTGMSVGIPEAQPDDCVVRIEATGLGANRRQDWLRLKHGHGFAVDVSGWRLAGDVTFELPGGTVIPAGGGLVVVSDGRGFLDRTESPRTGESLLVVGGFKGSLKKAKEVRLEDGRGRVVDRWTGGG